MIYHIVRESDWLKALDAGEYKPESLHTEGFVHCSTEEQLMTTAERYYAEETEPLVVLFIIDKFVKETLKFEPSTDGELFPHVYGKIPFHSVETTRSLTRKGPGKWELD